MALCLSERIIILLVPVILLVTIPGTGSCQKEIDALETVVHGSADSRNVGGVKEEVEPSFVDSRTSGPAAFYGNPGALSGIIVNETEAEATITLDLTAAPDYSVVTTLRDGEKWLDLYLHRFVTALRDLPSEGKEITGEILVMENADRSDLRISIQIVPQGITYDIYQVDNSLVIRLEPR
jgi:hypothetical protein